MKLHEPAVCFCRRIWPGLGKIGEIGPAMDGSLFGERVLKLGSKNQRQGEILYLCLGQ